MSRGDLGSSLLGGLRRRSRHGLVRARVLRSLGHFGHPVEVRLLLTGLFLVEDLSRSELVLNRRIRVAGVRIRRRCRFVGQRRITRHIAAPRDQQESHSTRNYESTYQLDGLTHDAPPRNVHAVRAWLRQLGARARLPLPARRSFRNRSDAAHDAPFILVLDLRRPYPARSCCRMWSILLHVLHDRVCAAFHREHDGGDAAFSAEEYLKGTPDSFARFMVGFRTRRAR